MSSRVSVFSAMEQWEKPSERESVAVMVAAEAGWRRPQAQLVSSGVLRSTRLSWCASDVGKGRLERHVDTSSFAILLAKCDEQCCAVGSQQHARCKLHLVGGLRVKAR